MALPVLSHFAERPTSQRLLYWTTLLYPNSSVRYNASDGGDDDEDFITAYSAAYNNTNTSSAAVVGGNISSLDLIFSENKTNLFPSLGDSSAEESLPRWATLVWTVMLSCVLVLGLLGNVLVPVVVLRTRDLRTSTNFLLVNLAVADVLVLVVCLPTALTELHTRPNAWVLGEVLCE